MGLPREKLPVLESFVSIQGEGRNLGTPYVFIRVGGCPLRCRFCDTERSWKVDKESITHPLAVAAWAYETCIEKGISWISITGGEPMLYPEQLKDMMLSWHKSPGKIKCHIETSGRFYDADVHAMSDLWSMDIKTPCTAELQPGDLAHLKYMRSCDQVKCLIEDQCDLDYARDVHDILDGKCTLVLQPFNMNVDNNGTDESLVLFEQYRWIVERVFSDEKAWPNTIITPQFHILVWGNTPET